MAAYYQTCDSRSDKRICCRNIGDYHRFYSLAGLQFSVISGLDPEQNPMGNSRGKVARERVQEQYDKSNRQIASEQALKKRLCMRFYRLHTPLPYLLATRTETLKLISKIGFTDVGSTHYSLH